MAKFQVAPAHYYNVNNNVGFVVEMLHHWNGADDAHYAIGPYDEMGLPELIGPFDTEDAAQNAIDSI